MSGWPGQWISGRQKQAAQNSGGGVSLTNDHGTLYLTGDTESGEWLWLDKSNSQSVLENRP